MRFLGWSATLVAAVLLALVAQSCGSSAVPIDSIAQDKKVTALDSDETRGLCDWGKAQAQDKLGHASCNGQPIMFACINPPAECTATVAQWRQCIPAILDRLAQDPCRVLQLAFSGLAAFIEETPGCEGLGACGTMMPLTM